MQQIGDRAWHYIHKSDRFGSPSMIRKACRGNSSHLTTGLFQITLTIIAKDNNHQCLRKAAFLNRRKINKAPHILSVSRRHRLGPLYTVDKTCQNDKG